MTQRAAPMSLSIKLVTGLVLLLTAGSVIGTMWDPPMWIGAVALTLVSALCFLFAPVSYSLDGGFLIVRSRVHSRRFGPVLHCRSIESVDRAPSLIGLRLFGNGGVFAGAGWFWNRTLGVFRAYVTSARREDLVIVETPARKIVISPADAWLFVQSHEPAR